MKKLLFLFAILLIASCSPVKKNLVGYWYKPKSVVNISFHRDKTFEYNDYDSTTNKSIKRTGTYTLNRPVLTLEFSDKTIQTLSFDKAITANKNYYLKKGDDYFIKEERVNNAVPSNASQQ